MPLFRILRLPLFAAALLGLVACAGARAPLDTKGVDASLTVERAVLEPEAVQGRVVEWGGVVINTSNLKDATRIEVLSYPLDDDGRPKLGGTPLGRFLAVRSGYLETAVFSPGRLVTIVGPVYGSQVGKIGETEYQYPAVSADQLHLWPVPERGSEPRVHVGIGLGFGTFIR